MVRGVGRHWSKVRGGSGPGAQAAGMAGELGEALSALALRRTAGVLAFALAVAVWALPGSVKQAKQQGHWSSSHLPQPRDTRRHADTTVALRAGAESVRTTARGADDEPWRSRIPVPPPTPIGGGGIGGTNGTNGSGHGRRRNYTESWRNGMDWRNGTNGTNGGGSTEGLRGDGSTPTGTPPNETMSAAPAGGNPPRDGRGITSRAACDYTGSMNGSVTGGMNGSEGSGSISGYSSCENVAGWVDSQERTCEEYEEDGWLCMTAVFDADAENISAVDACCTCGGGCPRMSSGGTQSAWEAMDDRVVEDLNKGVAFNDTGSMNGSVTGMNGSEGSGSISGYSWCENVAGWVDSQERTCEEYEEDGWLCVTAVFDADAENVTENVTAGQACCTCGGGEISDYWCSESSQCPCKAGYEVCASPRWSVTCCFVCVICPPTIPMRAVSDPPGQPL